MIADEKHQLGLSSRYYKLYIGHLSRVRQLMARFNQYYNAQMKEHGDVLLLYDISRQQQEKKLEFTTNPFVKPHHRINKPDYSFKFDKNTVLDLENDAEYQRLKQERLKQLKTSIQDAQKQKMQQFNKELQDIIAESDKLVEEAHAVMQENEYLKNRQQPSQQQCVKKKVGYHRKVVPYSQVGNLSFESSLGKGQPVPTNIINTRFKLQDVESMRLQFQIIHYHLLKMFDVNFKPYINQFITIRKIKMEDRVDNIMATLSKEMERYVLGSRLVLKDELVEGYTLDFEVTPPYQPIQTVEYQDFLSRIVRERIQIYKEVFGEVQQLKLEDAERKALRTKELEEQRSLVRSVRAGLPMATRDDVHAQFFKEICTRRQAAMQHERDELREFKQRNKQVQLNKEAQRLLRAQELERNSREKGEVLRQNRISKIRGLNLRYNKQEQTKYRELERERQALVRQREGMPMSRQYQQVDARIREIEQLQQSRQEMRNGVKQLCQFNEEMGSLQKAIGRFSAYVTGDVP